LFQSIQFPYILYGAIIHVASPKVVVGNGKYYHRSIDEGRPIHLGCRWIRVSRKKGEDKCEHQEQHAEAIKEAANGPSECEFGGKKR